MKTHLNIRGHLHHFVERSLKMTFPQHKPSHFPLLLQFSSPLVLPTEQQNYLFSCASFGCCPSTVIISVRSFVRSQGHFYRTDQISPGAIKWTDRSFVSSTDTPAPWDLLFRPVWSTLSHFVIARSRFDVYWYCGDCVCLAFPVTTFIHRQELSECLKRMCRSAHSVPLQLHIQFITDLFITPLATLL